MLSAVAALALLQSPPSMNTLTAEEKKAGWKLLFNGRDMKGWHNFRQPGKVGEGWVVKDGVMSIANPDKAGDIVSDEQFQWFELSLDFNVGKGQNSGIMFHVVDDGEATWHSGPEIQIYDHPVQAGVETTGYLYQLYPAKVDASKPAGQWNNMRILISPEKSQTHVNGVKYYEFKFGSEDFWARVKKSKFAKYPQFAKAGKGHIAIQGDHGLVSFRNVKIRSFR